MFKESNLGFANFFENSNGKKYGPRIRAHIKENPSVNEQAHDMVDAQVQFR